jgi:hypothetical protein
MHSRKHQLGLYTKWNISFLSCKYPNIDTNHQLGFWCTWGASPSAPGIAYGAPHPYHSNHIPAPTSIPASTLPPTAFVGLQFMKRSRWTHIIVIMEYEMFSYKAMRILLCSREELYTPEQNETLQCRVITLTLRLEYHKVHRNKMKYYTCYGTSLLSRRRSWCWGWACQIQQLYTITHGFRCSLLFLAYK